MDPRSLLPGKRGRRRQVFLTVLSGELGDPGMLGVGQLGIEESCDFCNGHIVSA